MSDDVVAALDRWLGQWESGYFAGAPSLETIPLVQRARDEIIALRRTIRLGPDLPALAREQALEEAARTVMEVGGQHDGYYAAAILALKDRA